MLSSTVFWVVVATVIMKSAPTPALPIHMDQQWMYDTQEDEPTPMGCYRGVISNQDSFSSEGFCDAGGDAIRSLHLGTESCDSVTPEDSTTSFFDCFPDPTEKALFVETTYYGSGCVAGLEKGFIKIVAQTCYETSADRAGIYYCVENDAGEKEIYQRLPSQGFTIDMCKGLQVFVHVYVSYHLCYVYVYVFSPVASLVWFPLIYL